jgi:DNA recombination protein RmuC
MTTELLSIISILIGLVAIFLLLKKSSNAASGVEWQKMESALDRIEKGLKEDFRTNREETQNLSKENRAELNQTLKDFQRDLNETLRLFKEDNQKMSKELLETIKTEFKEFRVGFESNFKDFTEHQRVKFDDLVKNTDKRLEDMRVTVDEKLQKTLNERLGQSFEAVGNQLKAVQEGLGEMKTLAQDVGGLKKVLSNVKQRGGLGEVQLEMLLEQILAPEQYVANVKTKQGSNDLVEFAIKLPGRDDQQSYVYLPIDAKFPKDAYEQLVDAYDGGDPAAIDASNKNLEAVIKKMAKDIRDKYIDPPHTTDFAIMFLPFEGIYAEVIRRSNLLEQLQREFKVIVTGPTTLAAILNSLQMGFRTLALQKRSSEVWTILGAVKTEFEKFGGLLEKAQKNIQLANGSLDELIGTRTKAINRKLKDIQALPSGEAPKIIPDVTSGDSDE